MAKVWFSGYHTGNTVKTLNHDTIGDLIQSESLDMNGATIMVGRGGHDQKVTDYNFRLADGDVVTVQKTSVKSGGYCTSKCVSPTPPPRPVEDIPRLVKDSDGNVILVNRDVWAGLSIFSGTVVVGKSYELGAVNNFLKSRFVPYYGKVEIEYKR